MRIIAYTLLVGICYILQSTLFSQFNISGIIPNLLLIITASIGFKAGRKSGLIIGFVSGLLTDIFFGQILGMYAFIYMYVGFANGTFKKLLFPGDFKLPLILVACSDFAYGHVIYVLMFLFKGDFHYLYYLTKVILPEVIYTTIIACALVPLINFILNKIEIRERLLEGEENFE